MGTGQARTEIACGPGLSLRSRVAEVLATANRSLQARKICHRIMTDQLPGETVSAAS